ncbi:MAG: polysaccharide deacetylase family protein [Clostridia bacterium]|nr:polysaccharide deacetylase family protein [Clostridia bacterium]
MIIFDLFPNGKTKAVTFSYDDGDRNDAKLIEIFNKYGVKGTFNLVSGWVGLSDNFLSKSEVYDISKTHEIANHTRSHQWNERIPVDQMIMQVAHAKSTLEDIVGKPVLGYAYPNGQYNNELLTVLKGLNIAYARTAGQSNTFAHPSDFLLWTGTCHHDNAIPYAKKFVSLSSYSQLPIFYIWGHAHDFARRDNWNVIIETLDILKDDNDKIWYATNFEIYEYLTAIKNLRITSDYKCVYNPSCISVYATADGEPVEFKPGYTILK